MKPDSKASAWLGRRSPEPENRVGLFCLPYAGGASSLFRSWPAQLPDSIEALPVHLPGRDRHGRDAGLETIGELARALVRGLEPELETPFAIFGHSMGALLAFEFCQALLERGLPRPEHLFVAGFRSPELPDRNPILHGLPEPEFVRALELLGATPPEILELEGILALLLPTIRKDLELVETYRWVERPQLDVPITAFCARADPLVSCEEMRPWVSKTTGAFELVELEGGHFFLESARDELLARIESRIGKRARR